MHIAVVGLSHRTAPVEIRERLSIAEQSIEESRRRERERREAEAAAAPKAPGTDGTKEAPERGLFHFVARKRRRPTVP